MFERQHGSACRPAIDKGGTGGGKARRFGLDLRWAKEDRQYDGK
jgi:hypothetical protein